MTTRRYVGIDIHKRHIVAAAVDVHQQVVLKPQKLSVHELETWAQEHLRSTDYVALEATSNAWEVHDQLEPFGEQVSVANSHQIKMISSSSSKTDKHDALVLSKLLAANLLPEVWVPPQHVRDLRSLTRHRAQLITERSAAKNRLHALLHQHNLKLPEGKPFGPTNEEWWQKLPLSAIEQLQVKHDWQTIHHLNDLIAETETLIAELSTSPEWSDLMTFLIQLPGVGLYTGMTILAAIGNIQRFPTAQQLVGYAGLGARVRSSGDTSDWPH
jgi:transposase